ncbi:MAG: hypothetical protein IJI01_12960 [Butyrivibrio sp.]|uniref:hypothetical protein n=1 Tax=Butyrivibrio sp. TaxID=28121 RepID=UPI0025C22005|nr:hypothetical protein [Butyrivibrio sp.]MBQ6589570.1 hypothetical protein [Butyrivibrio sp.]
MNRLQKCLGVAMATLLSISSLTGCSNQDKSAVQETANSFMAILASDSTEDINKYATSEVANGGFVQLFNSDTLVNQIADGAGVSELTEESKAELDEFASLFSNMIQSYSISDTNLEKKDGTQTATAVATFKTSFAMDILGSESASNKINDAITAYNTNNAEEIAALYEEGTEVAEAKIYNDMLRIILEIYEDEIANSKEMTYAIVLDLEKNNETDSWIVTGVSDYDSSNPGSEN